MGLIAQEVMSLIREVVHVGDDAEQTLGLRYSELIPVLIKALQEQQQLIEQQKTDLSRMNQKVLEVDQLKEKLTRMETSIRRLEL